MAALPCLTGYADPWSARAGDEVRFMVSAEGPASYEVEIVRLVHGDLNPAGPGFKEVPVESAVNGRYAARRQETYPGSCVVVRESRLLDSIASFTLQALIWPTTPRKGPQTILGRWSAIEAKGYALMIDAMGCVALRLGADAGAVATFSSGVPLLPRKWTLVAASFDAESRTVTVLQEGLARYPGVATAAVAHEVTALTPAFPAAPFTMAAAFAGEARGRPVFAEHYNGKIDRPRLAGAALDRAAIMAARADALPPDLAPTMLGWWDLGEGMASLAVSDRSPHRLDGRLINLPTRAVTGHNWTGDTLRAQDAPEEYGAIHFHDDDLYDACWEPDFRLAVPPGMKSGVYAARLRAEGLEDYVPFFVRPALGKPTARIAYLAETATYMAYANFNVLNLSDAERWVSRLLVFERANLIMHAHPEWGRSLYDSHSDGSGITWSSRLRPTVNMRPKQNSSFGLAGSSLREFAADTHLLDWLETKGFAVDVITDEDLDREGLELLKPYRVLLTGTHPEYTSTRMWDALEAYTAGGGRMMYMGGNGFYWRIAFHPEALGAIELRRAGPGSRTWITEAGEDYQSLDGGLGGLWRNSGRAPQRLAGVGFVTMGFDIASYFRRLPESHDPRVGFAFAGIGPDEPIGSFGLIGGGAAGLEFDKANPALGTPPNALTLARSENHTESYLLALEETGAMPPNVAAPENPAIHADIVFFTTAGGGAVFSFSSQCWCGSLSHNGYANNVSLLTENVLRRFLEDDPL